MGQTALGEPVECAGDGTQDEGKQLRFGPGAERGGERRAGRSLTYQEACLLAARRGSGAIGQRGQQAVDAGECEALQGLRACRQEAARLHRHQPSLAVPSIGHREGGKSATGAG